MLFNIFKYFEHKEIITTFVTVILKTIFLP